MNIENKNNSQLLQTLLGLRRSQKSSFGSYYQFIESEIQKIKQSEGITYQIPEKTYLKMAIWYSPAIIVQTVFLIFWIATLFCFYKFFKLRKFNYKYFFVFFLTVLSGIFLVFTLNERKLNLGIVKKDTELKLGPDKNHISRKNLKFLEEVKVLDKVGEWYKVEGDSIIGWIENTDLELVNNNDF